MAEWNLPFAPPQQMEMQQEEYEEEPKYDPKYFLLCTQCKEPITNGEECMEFAPGVSGFGEKSGLPTVIDVANTDHERATLHIDCIYDYVFGIEEEVSQMRREELDAEDPRFCSACDAKLDGL